VIGSVNLLRLFDRSMVKPENNIAIGTIFILKVGAGYADGLICVVREDGEGAGSIKTYATDGGPVDIVLVDRSAD
jgi:hypothetical protein